MATPHPERNPSAADAARGLSRRAIEIPGDIGWPDLGLSLERLLDLATDVPATREVR